jgi:hypothetical protein
MKILKFRTAAFYSYWMGQTIPECPYQFESGSLYEHHGHFFGGPFYKWLKMKMAISTELVRDSVALTFLQSKKGMPRATKEEVREAEKKAFKTMTTPKVLPTNRCFIPPNLHHPAYMSHTPVHAVDGLANCTGLKVGIRRTVRQLFKNMKFSLNDLTKPYIPSTSSNYNRSRGGHGTIGEFEYDSAAFEAFRKEVSEVYENTDFSFAEVQVNSNSDEIGFDFIIDTISGGVDSTTVLPSFNQEPLLAAYRKFYWRVVGEALEEEPNVSVVGLAESLKIRIITKGPPKTYFVLKPFQKMLWKHLSKFDIFAFIGKPISAEDVSRHFSRSLRRNKMFLSGDYSAATDELNSWASQTACDVLFEVLEEKAGTPIRPLKELFERSLTGHTYIKESKRLYSNKVKVLSKLLGSEFMKSREFNLKSRMLSEMKDFSQKRKPQQRGQLMGSITSFVILCILNLSLCRYALEEAGEIKPTLPIHLTPCMINGDDCVLAYNRSKPVYHAWRQAGMVMGLSESLGKTFISDKWFTMNSRCFRQVKRRLIEIPFSNLGLAFGEVRSSVGGQTKDSLANLGDNYNALKENCLPEMWDRTENLFFYKNMDNLKRFNGPWSFPKSHGGLGMNRELTKTEKRLLSAVVFEDFPTLPVDKEWKTFDVLQKTFSNVFTPMIRRKRINKVTIAEQPCPLWRFSSLLYFLWTFHSMCELHTGGGNVGKEFIRVNREISKILKRGMKRMAYTKIVEYKKEYLESTGDLYLVDTSRLPQQC